MENKEIISELNLLEAHFKVGLERCQRLRQKLEPVSTGPSSNAYDELIANVLARKQEPNAYIKKK